MEACNRCQYRRFVVQLTDLMGFNRVGDKDIRDWISAALSEYPGTTMHSVTSSGDCDAADTSGNDVAIKWKVAHPDDLI